MRRFLTLVCLLVLAVPAGITISGCTRNPAGNYCNGSGYGPKITDLYTVTLGPQFTGISLAYGQTRQSNAPTGATCKSTSVSVSSWSYGTTNNQLVDISPTGNICGGTWNRNSGGGIADYTICRAPNPLPSTNGLPYAVAYITAAADGVTSNPVPVYVHQAATSISLVGPTDSNGNPVCKSQNQVAQLDSQACYSGVDANGNSTQVLLCAPSSITAASKPSYACPLPAGVTSVPTCENSIGTMAYSVGTSSVASINSTTNQITAELPGTTVITASLAGSGSSAGYFSTCPPASISVSLNGNTSGTVTQGVQQNLVTTVTDTMGATITGLTLDYQSTNPMNLTASNTGAITANFPGAASVYAICQPSTCNPAPINQVGVLGTGLSISSNPVDINIPGTASAFVWVGAPGQSQYFVPYELLSGTPGSTVRLPYVPNSMVLDRTGNSLYFGSQTELMVYSTSTNALSGQFTNAPGVVLAVAPSNQQLLVNDQIRQLFYIFNSSGAIAGTFGGLGVSAEWTPDSKTLYIVDSSAANKLPANIAAGITGHTDTLYVYNANTGFTSYPLTTSSPSANPNDLAVTIPGVGAYIGGATTVAHTWCPTGTPSSYSTMSFYPQGDEVNATADALAATTDGQHILGATLGSGNIAFSDIAVTIPPPASNGSVACPGAQGGSLQALTISHTLNQANMAVNATAVNQVVTSPAAVTSGTAASANSLSFVTYTGNTAGATLPYYTQTTAAGNTALGTVGSVAFTCAPNSNLPNASLCVYPNNAPSPAPAITAPIAGAFSPDNTLFFVSTSGDNYVHVINTNTLQEVPQQLMAPALPACTPVSAGGSDQGCKLPSTYTNPVVPASVVAVKPRATT